MIFPLNVVDERKNSFPIYFNNLTFKFSSDSAGHILLPFPYERFLITNRSPKLIVLPLGYNCPNKCAYCIQRKFKNSILNLSNLKKTIKQHIEDYNVERIHFIGGEPLLQWDVVKAVVKAFPQLRYSIITNGIHLNLENATFMADHGFSITISHDGESQHIQRGIDILQPKNPIFEIVEWLSYQTEVNITSVLCNDGISTLERWKYFKNIGPRFSDVSVKPIIPYKKAYLPLMVGRGDWDKYLADLIRDIYLINRYGETCGADKSLLTDYLRYDSDLSLHYDENQSTCPIFNPEVVTINQSGERQYCYNCDSPITPELTTKFQHKERLKICESCPMLMTCTGTCRLLTTSCFTEACNRAFYHNLAYFIYYVHQIYGYFITSIEGDFKHARNGILHVDA